MNARRICLAILVLAVSVFVVARAARKGANSTRAKTHGALERNYEFAGRVLRGEDPYRKPALHAPYPPSYGLVLAALRLFSLQGARIAWAVLQLLCLFLLLRHLLRCAHCIDPSRAVPVWVPLAAILLVLRYLSRDTSGGGGNLVWGTLVFLAVLRPSSALQTAARDARSFRRDRRGDIWTGVGLGIVLAAKPTPVLFLPWLWWRGRRRTCLLALGVAVLLHLAPLLFLGVDAYLHAYRHWIDGVLAYSSQNDLFATPAHAFPPFSWMHQSLRWALVRFLGTVPPEHVLDSPLWFPGLGLSNPTLLLLRRVLEAGIAITTLAVLFRVRRRKTLWIDLFACGLLSCATLLLSPIAWKSYHLWLLPLFFTLLLGLAWQRPAAIVRRRREIILGLCAYFVLCGLASQVFIGKAGKEFMQSLYVVTAGAAWLWTLSLRCLWELHAERPSKRANCSS